MKKIMLLSAVMGSLISINAFAHNIQPNQLLANVTVSDKGEITLNGNDVAYKSWSSTALPGKVRVIQHIAGRSAAKEKNQAMPGKVRVIQHIAGRSAAKEKNQAMIEAIKAAHFNQAKYQTTTIINADDAVVGTGMFVKSSAEKGKKENAHSQVILDDKSAVKNTWGLREKDSVIILLDKTGKVQFVKEGKLTDDEVKEVISRATALIAK
ncbi:MAG: YtfJ family protein [Haemophilus parainfluenzae]|nr:YtfJ family protein [Haemophilus parainfluenzae]